LLTGLLTQSNSPRIIQYIKEIEMWILRLLSSPVPVPGKTKLEVRLTLYLYVLQHNNNNNSDNSLL